MAKRKSVKKRSASVIPLSIQEAQSDAMHQLQLAYAKLKTVTDMHINRWVETVNCLMKIKEHEPEIWDRIVDLMAKK